MGSGCRAVVLVFATTLLSLAPGGCGPSPSAARRIGGPGVCETPVFVRAGPISACPGGGFVREYGTTFIVQPEISDDGVKALCDRIDDLLTKQDATRLFYDDMGRRRLAYEIQNFQKGHYLTVLYLDLGTVVPQLERMLRLEDSVLRFLTVQESEAVVDIEARKKEAAELERVRAEKAAERAAREAEEEAERVAAEATRVAAEATRVAEEAERAAAEAARAAAEPEPAAAEGEPAAAEGKPAAAEGKPAAAEGKPATAEGTATEAGTETDTTEQTGEPDKTSEAEGKVD